MRGASLRDLNRMWTDVTTQKRHSAMGKLGGKYAIGATEFESVPVRISRQGGKCQDDFTLFVPASRKIPWIVGPGKQRIEVAP
jgi:hypothetical protein